MSELWNPHACIAQVIPDDEMARVYIASCCCPELAEGESDFCLEHRKQDELSRKNGGESIATVAGNATRLLLRFVLEREAYDAPLITALTKQEKRTPKAVELYGGQTGQDQGRGQQIQEYFRRYGVPALGLEKVAGVGIAGLLKQIAEESDLHLYAVDRIRQKQGSAPFKLGFRYGNHRPKIELVPELERLVESLMANTWKVKPFINPRSELTPTADGGKVSASVMECTARSSDPASYRILWRQGLWGLGKI